MSARDVSRVAFLSRLSMPDDDARRALITRFASIVDWAKVLQSAPIDSLEPLFSVMDDYPMTMRPDVAVATPLKEALLSNAPSVFEGFFAVPKIRE